MLNIFSPILPKPVFTKPMFTNTYSRRLKQTLGEEKLMKDGMNTNK